MSYIVTVNIVIIFYSVNRLLDNGARLQIDSAHSSDAGMYTCQMSNIAGQTNVTYQLDVFSEKNLLLVENRRKTVVENIFSTTNN